MSTLKTDSLKNNNSVACSIITSVTGIAIGVNSKYVVDTGNKAISKVITHYPVKINARTVEPDNFEVEFNNNSVGAGAKAFVISKSITKSDETSLSSWKPGTIAISGQVGFTEDHWALNTLILTFKKYKMSSSL